MHGMHDSFNDSHVLYRWISDVAVPHFEPYFLRAHHAPADQTAPLACTCLTTTHSHHFTVLSVNGHEREVIVQCCMEPDHLAGWIVRLGYWPITTTHVNYAIPITDMLFLAQVRGDSW